MESGRSIYQGPMQDFSAVLCSKISQNVTIRETKTWVPRQMMCLNRRELLGNCGGLWECENLA
jgi:hypothetical protein